MPDPYKETRKNKAIIVLVVVIFLFTVSWGVTFALPERPISPIKISYKGTQLWP